MKRNKIRINFKDHRFQYFLHFLCLPSQFQPLVDLFNFRKLTITAIIYGNMQKTRVLAALKASLSMILTRSDHPFLTTVSQTHCARRRRLRATFTSNTYCVKTTTRTQTKSIRILKNRLPIVFWAISNDGLVLTINKTGSDIEGNYIDIVFAIRISLYQRRYFYGSWQARAQFASARCVRILFSNDSRKLSAYEKSSARRRVLVMLLA